MASSIQDHYISATPLLCLLDSGTTGCWISHTKVPGGTPRNMVFKVVNQTLASTFSSMEEIQLHNIFLPELHHTHQLDQLTAMIFTMDCHYHMILGRDLLSDLGLILNFSTKSMEWDKAVINMHSFPINTIPDDLVTHFLLESIDNDLDLNDSMSPIPDNSSMSMSGSFCQAKDGDPDGYKTKTIQESLRE